MKQQDALKRIPYEAITETADRRWTAQLLARLGSPSRWIT
jgi:hypothetical protein